MAKINDVQFIIPVPNQSYTDLRPTISGEDWDDIRATASDIAYSVGNEKLGKVLSGAEKAHTEPAMSPERVCFGDTCLNFYEATHQYFDDDGNEYISATKFTHNLVKEFPMEAIAKKSAEKKGKEPSEVMEGWECKGEVSKLWGSAVHKAVECKVKYDEEINDARLDAIASDFCEQTVEWIKHMEIPVIDPKKKRCGRIDCLVQLEDKDCIIVDFKTGDIHKKISWTEEGKEYDLKGEMLSLYQIQLSFYAQILNDNGYNVKGIEVWALEGDTWKQIKLKVLEV